MILDFFWAKTEKLNKVALLTKNINCVCMAVFYDPWIDEITSQGLTIQMSVSLHSQSAAHIIAIIQSTCCNLHSFISQIL